MKDKTPIFVAIVIFILLGIIFSPAKKVVEEGRSGKNEPDTFSSIGSKNSIDEENVQTGYSPNKVVAQDLKEVEKKIASLEKEFAKVSATNRVKSPYYDKIRMSNISGAKSSDPSRQYFTLSTNLKKTETANISGWYFKSEVTGYYAPIGKAALLPFPFTKTETDIVLQSGDRAIVTKGFSPIGISFRTNVCTGYFEENRTFIPSLARKCPLAKNEELPLFSSVLDRNDECVKIIEKIGRCTTKGSEFLRDLPDTVPQSCKTYIESQINYNSCVSKHFSDTDFPGNEYRIYLNKFGPLWRTERETISLYDSNGFLVDSISY